MANELQSWRRVWREGFAPIMSTEELVALRDACRGDDQRLVQGSTTTPPPLMCVQDWPCEAGCALCYPFAMTHGGFSLAEDGKTRVENPGACTVGRAEERFAQLCFDADQRMGEPAACRFFLNWFDDHSREEVRRELLAECELELESRGFNSPSDPVVVGAA